jgi:hypothetical protein
MSEHAVYGQEDRRYSHDGVLGQAIIAGLVTIALLFAVNPGAIVVRANLARRGSTDAPVREHDASLRSMVRPGEQCASAAVQ